MRWIRDNGRRFGAIGKAIRTSGLVLLGLLLVLVSFVSKATQQNSGSSTQTRIGDLKDDFTAYADAPTTSCSACLPTNCGVTVSGNCGGCSSSGDGDGDDA